MIWLLGLLVEPRLAIVEILLNLERVDEAKSLPKIIDEEDAKAQGLRRFSADLALLRGRCWHLQRRGDQAEGALAEALELADRMDSGLIRLRVTRERHLWALAGTSVG